MNTILRKIAVFFCIMLIATFAFSQDNAKQNEPTKSEEAVKSEAAPPSMDQVIGKIKDKPITRNDLKTMLTDISPQGMKFISPEDVVNSTDLSSFKNIIDETYVIYFLSKDLDSIKTKLLEKEKSEPKKTTDVQEGDAAKSLSEQIEMVTTNAKLDYYLKNFIFNKTQEVADEEIKKYYDEHKEQFLEPFSFKIRQIFVSTYVPYEVKEGDTLESIAEKISKDKEMVKLILTDDDQKKTRWVDPKDREKELFKPLEKGENLLVPMSAEDKEKAKIKALSIQKELKAGADFIKIAEKYSDGINPGEESGLIIPKNKPVLPEIEKAVKETKVGDVTDIIQTKHGFSILLVTEKKDENYQSFDKLKEPIKNMLAQEKQKNYFIEKLKDGIQTSTRIKLNKEVLMNDSAKADETILSIGDFSYKAEQFTKDFPIESRKEAGTYEKRLEALFRNFEVRKEILNALADDANFINSEDFKKKSTYYIAKFLVPKYIDDKVKQEIPKSDEKLKEFYEANLDKFKRPKEMELRQLGLKIGDDISRMKKADKEKRVEELKNKLQNIKAQVKDKESFEELVKKYSDEKDYKEKGGFIGKVPASYRGGFNGMFERMKENTVSDPVELGNYVYLYFATDVKESYTPNIDEIKTQVENAYIVQEGKKFKEKYYEKILKENNFELSKEFFPEKTN